MTQEQRPAGAPGANRTLLFNGQRWFRFDWLGPARVRQMDRLGVAESQNFERQCRLQQGPVQVRCLHRYWLIAQSLQYRKRLLFDRRWFSVQQRF